MEKNGKETPLESIAPQSRCSLYLTFLFMSSASASSPQYDDAPLFLCSTILLLYYFFVIVIVFRFIPLLLFPLVFYILNSPVVGPSSPTLSSPLLSSRVLFSPFYYPVHSSYPHFNQQELTSDTRHPLVSYVRSHL